MPRIRYNWGICTNRDMDGNGTPCPKCASKEKQKVLNGHEFVCAECGEPLHKVQAPKTFLEKYKVLLIIIAVLIVAGGIVAAVLLSGDKVPKNQPSAPKPAVEKTDTANANTAVTIDDKGAAQVEETETKSVTASSNTAASKTSAPAPSKPQVDKKPEKTGNSPSAKDGRGTVNLGYGVYTGELKNGKPHGYGTIKYTASHKIVSSKDFVANPGDTFEGEFRDGRIASVGLWYHDGEMTGVKP